MVFIIVLGRLMAVLAFCGAAYAVMAAVYAGRFARSPAKAASVYPPVTILKPLHGDEPRLEANLESFFAQNYPAPVQIVFGVQDAGDPAIGVANRLRARHPHADVSLVIDARRHGANAKVSNLMNMYGAARHDLLILSDADIGVPSDYLAKVTAALEPKEAGAVTCLYTGVAAGGSGSRFTALGIDYHFLPNVLTGLALGLAEPCFGSTIALRRALLEEIGGFGAFASYLADDYEIGRAVRAKGYQVAIPNLAVRHTCSERGIGDWLAHELRWARTLRVVAPSGHAGSVITYAIPLALLGAILSGFTLFSLAALATSLAARAVLKWRIDKIFGGEGGPLWLLPVRDVLSFGVFLASLFGGSVEWQGERLRVKQDGALSKS
ncbi:MAG: bacteriohopanetetrol glucosamine biosynthesis glycosyltransferase HpnI [Alphaproteobacteria bacterium]|nr:bacteriohopanetetrol glucosamine biosynthesis glycosyltransferase HpnI [Alphaproteobacteria bacterium]MDE2111545.1 bacteriohopanetetrol glucosamine biosynthesis glycosyltransferase HpnI [Alphaproteobacteria bacterium]MDE2494989.1 bacteriohopanetetrol glucosamine biosynthesis glycosyltransferase HpnI [Alphaproteobacteria bacterium]